MATHHIDLTDVQPCSLDTLQPSHSLTEVPGGRRKMQKRMDWGGRASGGWVDQSLDFTRSCVAYRSIGPKLADSLSTHSGTGSSKPVSYTHLTLPTKLEV